MQREVADATVERENTFVDAVIVQEGSVVDGQFRCDRVWIWVNESGIVTRIPQIG